MEMRLVILQGNGIFGSFEGRKCARGVVIVSGEMLFTHHDMTATSVSCAVE